MTEKKEQLVKLCEIIKNNPGAVAYIDNDSWHLHKSIPLGYDDWSEDKQAKRDEGCELAISDDYPALGNCYGYGLLEAMAFVFGIKLEGV